MGRNLEGFDVKLTFTPDGKIETATYWDQEGCGHEKEFIPDRTTLDEIIQYYLAHYQKSHDMKPPSFCGATMEFEGRRYVCTLKPHNSNNGHDFVSRGRV